MAKKKKRHKSGGRDQEDSGPRRKRGRDRDARDHDDDSRDDEEKGERIRRLLNELARELIGDVGPLVMGRIEKYLTAFHAGKKKRK